MKQSIMVKAIATYRIRFADTVFLVYDDDGDYVACRNAGNRLRTIGAALHDARISEVVDVLISGDITKFNAKTA